MTGVQLFPMQYLVLDDVVINKKVARLLPPDLARRYHALPVSKANGAVTVAMADPGDMAAREVIAQVLARDLYVVQADRQAIDARLTELWPQQMSRPLRLLVHCGACAATDELLAYAHYLAQLLHGHLTIIDQPDTTLNDLSAEARAGYDLVILGQRGQSFLNRMLTGPVDCHAVEQIPASVLAARCPRWPLRRILLVTRGQGLDAVAVDWIIRLAQSDHAAVTVLAVQPALSGPDTFALTGGGLPDWLTTDTPLGRQLRQIARHLVDWEIEGKLRFRQGLPDWQIKSEINEGNHDLVIIANDPVDWWSRRLLGRLVGPLLSWIDRPVLVAKSAAE